MSDRIAVMMDGDLLQLGPPDEVYENPNDIRVAEFIGSPKMNILPATCYEKGVITCLGQKIKVALKNSKNQSVSIGIRPEHLILQPKSKASFSGELTYKENLGSDVFLHLDIGLTDQKVVIRTEPQESNSSKIGETISFSASHNKYLVFDQNGKRLDAKKEGKV
jgi:multiple sugar transport system ATP-binding protein